MTKVKEGTAVLSSWRYLCVSAVVAQKYDAASNTELTYGSAADGYAGFDRFGRLIETLWKCGSTELVHSSYGRNPASGVVWCRDDLAHAMSVDTQDNYYRYDGLQQVTGHDRGNLVPSLSPPPAYSGIDPMTRQQEEGFAFDETGNWLSTSSQSPALTQDREHNPANQIDLITGPSGVVQLAYDAAGNMTTMPQPGDWTAGYDCTWDAWNRLVMLTEGSNHIGYAYDALTRRTTKINSATSETRHYYYDRHWRAVEERVAGATHLVDRQYTWSPADRWTLIRRKRSTSGSLSETHYVLKDYLDPAAVIDSSATVDERYGYDAFGPVRIMDEDFVTLATSSCDWNFLFHGEFLDTDTGLYNYGHRYYHPLLGRWPSRDPIGEDGGINLYGFVQNGPPSKIDYLGMVLIGECVDIPAHPKGSSFEINASADGETFKGTVRIVDFTQKVGLQNVRGQIAQVGGIDAFESQLTVKSQGCCKADSYKWKQYITFDSEPGNRGKKVPRFDFEKAGLKFRDTPSIILQILADGNQRTAAVDFRVDVLCTGRVSNKDVKLGSFTWGFVVQQLDENTRTRVCRR